MSTESNPSRTDPVHPSKGSSEVGLIVDRGYAQATEECPACGGTGLYVGIAERDGAAVVCSRCRGTGARLIRFKIFTGQQTRTGIIHVFGINPGIIASGTDRIVSGGVPYSQWVEDPTAPFVPGAEMRSHSCPAWWYQSANYGLKPDWNDEERKCIPGGSFSNCPFFVQKAGCWEKWDREHNPVKSGESSKRQNGAES